MDWFSYVAVMGVVLLVSWYSHKKGFENGVELTYFELDKSEFGFVFTLRVDDGRYYAYNKHGNYLCHSEDTKEITNLVKTQFPGFGYYIAVGEKEIDDVEA